MGIWKYVTEGPYVPIRYAHQLERELHIAKQALESILKNQNIDAASYVVAKQAINTLSA